MTPSTPAPGPTPQIRGIDMTVERCIQFCTQYRDTVAEIRRSGKRPEIAEHDIAFIELVGEYLSALASTPQGAGAVAWAVTFNGEITRNIFCTEAEADRRKRDLDEAHPEDLREVRPLVFASPSSPNVGGYDEAVAALAAAGLRDGFIYKLNGTRWLPPDADARIEEVDVGRFVVVHEAARTPYWLPITLPGEDGWVSLRRIVSGRVVNGGEG